MSDEPQAGLGTAKIWLDMLSDAHASERLYHDKLDKIEEIYADLQKMSGDLEDRQFRLFWANIEVLRPTVYAKPPQPVVSPKFKDRRPLQRRTADLLERALEGMFEAHSLHEDLKGVRDDFLLGARGQAWLRLREDSAGLFVDVEHLGRQDFTHEPARSWREVTWVARRGFLTREQMRKRFGEELSDGIDYKRHNLGRSDEGESYEPKKAAVWEIWHKTRNRVVWVTKGSQDVLDEREPYHDLRTFWPCPRPCFGTLKPGTLKPVPDYFQYRDQLEEIQELTARIHAVSEGLRVQGFYPAGASDIGEAVELLLADGDNRAMLVPVKNMAALGGTSLKDSIQWLPLGEIAQALRDMIGLRQQTIQDIYEITGLSDILRGETDANETATAQKLKAQFGNTRVKVRQEEMARFARDVVRISAELLAENFPIEDLMRMAQIDDLPSRRDIALQAIQRGANPMALEQVIAQAEQQAVTREKVQELLTNERVRAFTIEVETDSTIAIDENAEQESRVRFLEAFGGYIQQMLPIIQQAPQAAEIAAEALRFGASAFRIDRRMDDAIDAFADMVSQAQQQQPQQPQQPAESPADAQKAELEMQRMAAQVRKSQADAARSEIGVRQQMAGVR